MRRIRYTIIMLLMAVTNIHAQQTDPALTAAVTTQTFTLKSLFDARHSTQAQQTDPALTAAVTTQTFTLKSLFDARHSTQEKILAATGIENVQLQQLHDIEKKVLDYMANVSGLMQNLYQVKRTTELVTVEIPKNINEVTKACKGHLKGTAIALAVSDEVKSVYTEIASLSALVREDCIVT